MKQNKKEKEKEQVMKDYFRFYQKSFLVSFGVGFLGIFFMVNALTIRIFLLSQGMGGVIWFFSGVFFIILVFTVMFTYLSGTLQLSLGKTIKLGAKHIVELLPGAVAALVIGLVGLFLGGVFRAFLILSFSLGAMVQTKLSEKTLSKINIRS